MKYKAYWLAHVLLGMAIATSWPSLGQDQKGGDAAKRQKSNPPQKLDPPKAGENRDMSLRKKKEARSVGEPAWDFWYPTTHGGFHLAGQTGRGIYRWPAPAIVNRHDTLTFVHDYPVGPDEGWTYKVDGTNTYFFFSTEKTAYCGYARWQISVSYDDDIYFPFSCAD